MRATASSWADRANNLSAGTDFENGVRVKPNAPPTARPVCSLRLALGVFGHKAGKRHLSVGDLAGALGLFLGETHEPEVVDARPVLFLSRWYCLGNGGMHVAPDRIWDRLTDDLATEDASITVGPLGSSGARRSDR